MFRKRITFLIFSVGLIASIVVAGIAGGSESSDNLYRDLSLFTEVVDLIETMYVDPVAPQSLIEGAFSGLAEAVDEYSYYVPAAEMEDYELYRKEAGEGIGAVVSKRLGYAYVVAVINGSPAEEAGIEAGDFIERINGELTSDMPVWRIDSFLRFVSDDEVDLTIVRSGMSERDTFEFDKSDWQLEGPTLSWSEGVPVVDLSRFDESTPRLMSSILKDIEERGASGMVIDLRGNAGGDVDSAIDTADLFLDGGVIAELEGRRIETETWEASPGAEWNGELVILIDPSTAGSAEVFAAAISGNDRGRTVGLDTYGMSGVQRFIELESGGGLYVTVGHYRGADDRSPASEGVRPDIPVARADLILARRGDGEERDIILERGLQALRG